MYGQNVEFQSGGSAERGVPRTHIAPSDVPTAKLVTNGTGKVWAVNENGKPLGIITKSHPIHTVQGFQRIRDFALQHQAGVILGKKAVFVVVVSGKLIKIFLVVSSITKKLKKRILTMSNIVGLFGSASHVLKKSLNNVNRKLP